MSCSTIETPSQAPSKRRKAAHDGLFPSQYIPVPVIGVMLEFLDVASMVRVAACNRNWRFEVFGRNHPQLWNRIEFSSWERRTELKDEEELKSLPAARLTDFQLGALLRNCRAVERCKVLKLKGCIQIRGEGLEPLRGSCVLQDIDLRLLGPGPASEEEATEEEQRAAATEGERVVPAETAVGQTEGITIDDNVVLPILSTMVPMAKPVPHFSLTTTARQRSHGLSLVKFDMTTEGKHYYSRFKTEIGDWLFGFHQALRKRAKHNEIVCGYCTGNILEGKSNDCRQWIMGTAYCERCENYSCGEGSCPSTWSCMDCAVQCCQPMGPGSESQCPNHKTIFSCGSCTKLQCDDCFDGLMCANDECSNGEYCIDCLDALCSCEECQSEDENDLKLFCPDCFRGHQKKCHAEEEDQNKEEEETAMSVD